MKEFSRNFSKAQSVFRLAWVVAVFVFFCSGVGSRTLFAQEFQSVENQENTTSSLVSEVSEFKPGEPFRVFLKLEHPLHWHSYYVNPVTVGELISVKWALPPGFSVDDQSYLWPIPQKSTSSGFPFFGYSGTVVHVYTIIPPSDSKLAENYTITAKSSWQICSESGCRMEPDLGAVSLSAKVIAANSSKINPEAAETAQIASKMTPTREQIYKISATDDGKLITIKLVPGPKANLEPEKLFIFDEKNQLDPSVNPEISKSGTAFIYKIPRNKGNPDKLIEPGPVESSLCGIVTSKNGISSDGKIYGQHFEAFFSVEQVAISSQPIAGQSKTTEKTTIHQLHSTTSLFGIFAGMFLGGLILNLMPCVFPVIGLKIMSFVQQGAGNRRKIAGHGFVFVLGVMISFWAMALALWSVRSGAFAGFANWILGAFGQPAKFSASEITIGFQLENPWMIFAMIVVFLFLALNMFGLFEIGVSATGAGGNLGSKKGFAGSFFSGVLATIVATPCAGPYLGVAAGAAIKLPITSLFIAFSFMGLGMALPYLIMAIFPGLVSKLPRPGAWMESLKQGLSFLLFATVAWLLWTYFGQVEDPQKQLFAILGIICFAFAGWVYGRWCPIFRKKMTRRIAAIVALASAITGIVWLAPPIRSSEQTENQSVHWEAWSPQAVQTALDSGRPVFVDFTARWCLTCQANKKIAYSNPVTDLFSKHKVLLLKADKTKPNEEINKELGKLNRAQVPVNVLYLPKNPRPQITRENLTSDYLFEFLTQHLEAKK